MKKIVKEYVLANGGRIDVSDEHDIDGTVKKQYVGNTEATETKILLHELLRLFEKYSISPADVDIDFTKSTMVKILKRWCRHENMPYNNMAEDVDAITDYNKKVKFKY